MSNTRTRLDPKERKKLILSAAVAVMKKHGITETTRELVAEEADVATGTVSLYFNTMKQLRRAMVRHAMATEDGEALASVVSLKDYKKMMKPEHIQLAVQHISG